MSGIDRIGSSGKVSRDSSSAGLEAQARREGDELRAQSRTSEPRNARLDEAAKMMEKQFLREMVRAMRGTVGFGALKPSMAENMYRGELDNQYVESWGDGGGVGLADLIYDQVMERHFNSKELRPLKGQPIPLTDRDVSRVMRMKSNAGKEQVPLRIELKDSALGEPAKIQAPWDADVLSNTRLEGGKTALTLQHGPGLRSTLVFQGVASAGLEPGTKVQQGRALGVLSPEIRSFFWNLRGSQHDLDTGRVDSKASGLHLQRSEQEAENQIKDDETES